MAAVNLSGDNEFSRHCSRVVPHCPFLGPSARIGALHVRTVHLSGEDLAAESFYALVEETERFRIARRAMKSRTKAALLCHNLILSPPASHEGEPRDLFDWPHYIARLLYTDVGILFGKFWQGEMDVAKDGTALPSPPVSFWSIRSKVERRDVRFFEWTPSLLARHVAAQDDEGHDPHARFGVALTASEMRAKRYYETVMAWARQRLDAEATG